MSIIVRGMEMPVQCASCKLFCFMQFKGEIKDVCNAIGRLLENPYQRPDWCPLVPVPPHERLIEESKVLDIVSEWCPDDDGSVGKDGDLREMLDEIEAIPTIIPGRGE